MIAIIYLMQHMEALIPRNRCIINTAVCTPDGHTGRVRVTRRERQLIADEKKDTVRVKGTDGLEREYPIDSLQTFPEWNDVTDYELE